MNENSYLNPSSIHSQSRSAINKLIDDNRVIEQTETSLNNFVNDNELKGDAFAALKQQISDYKVVLNTIRSANESDIMDFITLNEAIGHEVLDGATIIEQQKTAISSRDENNRLGEEYYRKARDEQYFWMQWYYEYKKSQYYRMAKADQDLYDSWAKKEAEYDRIEADTSLLFEGSKAIRAVAKKALNNIFGGFKGGVYAPYTSEGWRIELLMYSMERVLYVSEDGQMRVKMNEVSKILSKDAQKITEEEYQAVALAYILADEKDVSTFLQYISKDRKDREYTLLEDFLSQSIVTDNSEQLMGMVNSYDNIRRVNEDYSEWTVDYDKLMNVMCNVAGYSEGTLDLIQKYRSAGNDEDCLTSTLERNQIVQRMTLLNVFGNIGKFRGDYKADYPTIKIEKDDNQSLILKFYEDRNVGNNFTPIMSTLGESTVTISSTVNGAFIDNKEIDYAEYSLLSRFGTYSATSETAGFVYDEVTGMAIDAGCGKLAEVAVEKTGKKVLGQVIGYIPLVGDIAGFAIEAGIDAEQAKQDAEAIKSQFDMVKAAEVYSEFDCSVSFVEFNTADIKYRGICPYAGEQTDLKIAAVNEKLGEFLSNDLTRDIVLQNPKAVWEFEQEINGCFDIGVKYEKIISNK